MVPDGIRTQITNLELSSLCNSHPGSDPVSVSVLPLAWLLAQPPICSVISGATKAEQVVSNVKASDWQLTAEELKEVDAMIKLY